jgi:hypothetical protein
MLREIVVVASVPEYDGEKGTKRESNFVNHECQETTFALNYR